MVKQDEPITGAGAGINHLEPVTSKTSDVNIEKEEVKDVHATYHEAIAAAPFKPWSKSSIQLYFIFLVAYVNAMASGFDGVCTLPSCILSRLLLVHLQFDQRHGAVPELLSTWRAGIEYWISDDAVPGRKYGWRTNCCWSHHPHCCQEPFVSPWWSVLVGNGRRNGN
jgi:hypothetical protein